MRRPPRVTLGLPNISETTRARKLKLKMQIDMPKYSFWYNNVSTRGHPGGGGAAPPDVNLNTLIYHKVLEIES